MTLPDGIRELTTYDEVRAAWGDILTTPPDNDGEEGTVLFAANPRVAITVDAVFVQLRRPIRAGKDLELTDVLGIKEPTVNEIRLTDRAKGDVEKAITLLASLCGIPTSDVNQMPASDFRVCSEVVGAFLSE